MQNKFNAAIQADPEGNASISLAYRDNPTREEKLAALAEAFAEAEARNGSTAPDPRRWKKILSENRLPHGETPEHDRILAFAWLRGYSGTEDSMVEYVRRVNEGAAAIAETNSREGRISCPRCGETPFEYGVGETRMVGACRAGCGFQLCIFHSLPPKWGIKKH